MRQQRLVLPSTYRTKFLTHAESKRARQSAMGFFFLRIMKHETLLVKRGMTNIQKRFWLFVIGCLGSRCLLVYIAKTATPAILALLGYLALLPAAGFLYLFLTGSRKTGAEVFGDKIWWNSLRPVHALLYFLFAYSAISNHRHAWLFLLADVVIGAISFLLKSPASSG